MPACQAWFPTCRQSKTNEGLQWSWHIFNLFIKDPEGGVKINIIFHSIPQSPQMHPLDRGYCSPPVGGKPEFLTLTPQNIHPYEVGRHRLDGISFLITLDNLLSSQFSPVTGTADCAGF
jgi:hypothetical protein